MQVSSLRGAKVLVTGATGFTGQVVVRKLLESGAQVRIIARPSTKAEGLKKLNVEVIEGQVYDKQICEQAVSGVEYILHVAAAFREPGIKDEVYRLVHVTSTQYLTEAAIKEPSFKRFVHVSTMGVHGHIENPPGNENSPYSPGDEYQRTKLEGELWIRDFAKSKAMSLTVIRPTGIYGPGDRRLLKVFKMSTWPIFPILGYGKCLYHLTHVEDLANVIILAATHPAAEQEIFLCGADQAIPLVEIKNIVCKTLKKKSLTLRIPVSPFFWLADLCEIICKPLGIDPPIYRRRVAFYTKDRSFDTSKMRNLLGYQNTMSNEEGIKTTALWYQEQGWLK